MKRLYLDLDDTFVCTEEYMRTILKNAGLGVDSRLSTVYCLLRTEGYETILRKILANYDIIPLKDGAEDALKLLKYELDVVFWSSYTFEEEKKAKKAFADSFDTDIVLINYEDDPNKEKIDVSESIIVDDSLDVLSNSKSKTRIQMYNPYISKGLSFSEYLVGDIFASDLYSVVDSVLSGGCYENNRRHIQTGVQTEYNCSR